MTSLRPDLTTHGPCSTTAEGTTEVDYAFCFKSDKLPKEAHYFVQRLHRAGWPSTSTLQRIVSGGCHFVAIGAKESPTELIEWRHIFFSHRENVDSFYEPCSVPLLWSFKNIFEGGYRC